MRTRIGRCYTTDSDAGSSRRRKRPRIAVTDEETPSCCVGSGLDFLDSLPEDIVLLILCKLSATAMCPADLLSIRSTCKRLNQLSMNPMVLWAASSSSLAVKATNWSEPAQRFLEQCASSGNPEACYMLGMIRFYCYKDTIEGKKLMARAAVCSNAAAVYSLAVIQFNGSGGSKDDKDLRGGAALCARAAFHGHVDAIRELGHCLQDGYGVRRNVAWGRHLLVKANALELASSSSPAAPTATTTPCQPHRHTAGPRGSCPLFSDFGCNIPTPKPHPANQFLVDWFSRLRGSDIATSCGGSDGDKLHLCSHSGCGRPETRRHEFRRCSVCGAVNYCSRACQALDWKLRHKAECVPMERWLAELDHNAGAEAAAADALQPGVI